MNTNIETDPFNTKKKRVSWKSFDRLMECFNNDPRVFIITETGDGFPCKHRMTMRDIIGFWDGGIVDSNDMDNMLSCLETANSCEIGQTKTNEIMGENATFERIA